MYRSDFEQALHKIEALPGTDRPAGENIILAREGLGNIWDYLDVAGAARPLHLTPTETEVLEQTSLGLSTREQADDRHCSPDTIHVHQRSIGRKLGTSSMSQSIRLSIISGILPVEVPGRDMSDVTAQSAEILSLISLGMTGNQIARFLSIGPGAVEGRYKNARLSLGARNRPHTIRLGYEEGFFQDPDRQLELARGLRPFFSSMLNGGPYPDSAVQASEQLVYQRRQA